MLPEKSSEFRLIERFRAAVGDGISVPVGIGDDAAVVRWKTGTGLLAADMLLEGVHFQLSAAEVSQVGRKAVAVNLSDVAAMAGIPTYVLVSLALPRSADPEMADELFSGMIDLTDEFDVVIVGGDTNSWDGPLIVSVAVAGDAPERGAVTRSDAQAGDWIFVTGDLGGSLMGKHLNFTPRLREAQRLYEAVKLHSMIDVSDGLIADLYHILEESDVGAIIEADSIPVSAAAGKTAAQTGKPPLEHALGDGEDFELLFTVSAEAGRKLVATNPLSIQLSHIGIVTDDVRCVLTAADGEERELPRLGWSHALSQTD